MTTTSKRSSSAPRTWSNVGGLPQPVPPAGKSALHQPVSSRNCPSCAATGSWSLTRATTCAIAKASAIGPSRNTSAERKQVHPALGHTLQQDLPRPLEPAPPLRPRGQGHRASAREPASGHWRDRVHPPASVLRPLPGSLREERVRRRLARADAPVSGPPHAQLHPGQLRPAPTQRNGRKYLDVRRMAPAPISRSACRRPSSSRSTRKIPTTSMPASTATDVVDADQRSHAAALRPGQLRHRTARMSRPRRRRGQASGRPVPRRQAPDGVLPDQPVQAAGKQRAGVHSVRRTAHPAQLRLPARHRDTSLPLPIGTQDAGLLG